MNKLIITISFTFIILLLSVSCKNDKITRKGEPDVYNVEEENKQMNEAMEKARNTIDIFKKYLKNPKENQTYFSLKAKFGDGDNIEHIWLNQVEYEDKFFYGNVGNEPVDVKNIKFDQKVSLKLERISDWMIIEDNKLIGGYTIRVLRDRMTEKERKDFDDSFGVIIE